MLLRYCSSVVESMFEVLSEVLFEMFEEVNGDV